MFHTWKNRPESYTTDDNSVTINAPEGTDYFNDPASELRKRNAPMFVRGVSGDFTVQGRVMPEFTSTFDAGALVFYCSDEVWVKLAFEQTDMGDTSIVTVVTNGLSDDANGEVVDDAEVYLKMTRRDDAIGLYYSVDGERWRMVRLFSLPVPDRTACYVGVSAQSPLGSGCTVRFTGIEFTDHSVEDLRSGV